MKPLHEIPDFLPAPMVRRFRDSLATDLDERMTCLHNGTYSRLKKKDVALAQELTGLLQLAAARDEALRAWLGGRWQQAYVNPFFFWTGYSRGGHIKSHVDGTASNGAGGKSFATILLYVNHDYQGGETVFVGPPETTVTPRAGKALLLRQAVLHHARPVEAGRKLLVRTDLMLPP